MTPSSRTPEGEPNRCPVCGSELRLEPSRPPGDAPCPSCGSLLWFPSTPSPRPSVPGLRAAGGEPNGKLVIAGGDPIPLSRPHLTLGRRTSCDICLMFPQVSGIHCELDFEDGWWTVRDRNGTSGIMVNGVSVAQKV